MSTETKVKHTPGPWTDVSDWENASFQDGMALVTTPKSKQAIDCTHSGATFEEDLANARLIAAAPQLLEALEGLTGLIYDMQTVYGSEAATWLITRAPFQDARTAIKSAKGEAQ